MAVHIYDRWGNPAQIERLSAQRKLAEAMGSVPDEEPHGLTPQHHQAMENEARRHKMDGFIVHANKNHRPRWDNFVPDRLFKQGQHVNQSLFAAGSGGGNSASLFTAQVPFLPEWAHPANYNFPTSRRQANSNWRLFFKMDPIVAAVIDLLSQLPWSDVQFTGEGVDGEIKERIEFSWTKTKMNSKLPELTKEYHVTGEGIPHLHYDDNLGCFTYLAIHNPDNINVVYSPFIDMEPILEFVPDDKLKHIATSNHPALIKVRETMPADLVGMLRANQNIPLASSNVSFIPRKQHDYELRGTSILARLWQLYYSEYPMWSAFAATARRGATPMKTALLGDPASNMYATPAEERRFKELVAQLESDPQGWLVWNGQVKFDMVGNADRLMSINTHYDLFERMKLTALGVSKAFIAGEASYQSAAAGLTIFMQRLLSLRNLFVHEWIIPKFLYPMAKANDWRKPDKASKGQFKIKRASADPMSDFIVPELKWAKSLDTQVDKDMLEVMGALEERLGVRISDQKKFACIGLEAEEEYKLVVKETKMKRDMAGNDPILQAALGLGGGDGGMGGGGGLGLGGPGMAALPGIPGEEFGLPGGEAGGAPPEMGGPGPDMGAAPPEGAPAPEMAPSPEGASLKADEGARPEDRPSVVDSDKAKEFLSDFDLSTLGDDPVFSLALKDKRFGPELRDAAAAQDRQQALKALEDWLVYDHNYGEEHLKEFRRSLRKEARGTLAKAHAASAKRKSYPSRRHYKR